MKIVTTHVFLAVGGCAATFVVLNESVCAAPTSQEGFLLVTYRIRKVLKMFQYKASRVPLKRDPLGLEQFELP